MKLDKAALVHAFCDQLGAQEKLISQAAETAREAATHEESKPENDKDTRALEASYLAGAQASRARELGAIRNALSFMVLRDFGPTDPIALSALVEIESHDRTLLYFLAAHGGGLKATLQKREVVIVTVAAPLGQALVGKRKGDSFALGERAYAVREIQ